MRSPGACRKWGRKWRSWMLSFSSPLSLDLDRGLRATRERAPRSFLSRSWITASLVPWMSESEAVRGARLTEVFLGNALLRDGDTQRR
ncbi:hypothetical protein EYF80_056021 [Liparis tanakae]|uniref:Uncharacterized protein n=1 Tax=Liparis tanakae TaxID=230148 RepID=A0A4Z2EYH4_9TELE|nr:hypothetical protein EYF80_056021 [Liparis tanakae]